MSDDPENSAAELLATPVQFLPGVGPQRAELLARLNLATARDVLFFFPRDYRDMSQRRTIAELSEDELAGVVGTVEEIELRNTGPGRSILGVLLRQGSDHLRAVWFNQPYLLDKFQRGQRLLLLGQPRRRGLRWEMAHPRFEALADDEEDPAGQILPVYPLTEGLTQDQLRRIVRSALEEYAPLIDEVFPDEFLDAHPLWPIRAALPQIHFPSDMQSLDQARRRFVYQELLVLQLALALRRRSLTTDCRATALPTSALIDARICRLFPFELTAGQKEALAQVAADMGRDFPMNRLLHGEVGSGKTVVAMYAMLLAVAHHHQAALMAPTEILARQHVQTLIRALAESRVRIGLVTGSLSAEERRRTLEDLAQGNLDIAVGTQAIVQPDVRFARLGLVVIDEQHKFGVRQRALLRQAGLDPHYLVMTATPIPRTVGMTLFGDLDVSTLREMPPGRQTVYTYLAGDEQRAQWWEFFRRKLREGRQGYVITPLVAESQRVQAQSLDAAYEHLANGELEEFRLALVHGRMNPAERDAAMDSFRRGQTQVLLATSVVEVGVDVPNATVMTIEDGDRFGLAQLHQLRGRVSRGTHPGYVCVFAEELTDEGRRRLEAFTQTTDGFRLAEIDFELRGPGDLLGTQQSGLPPLRIADLLRDAVELEAARRDAQALVASGDLDREPYARLKRMVLARYGKALELGDVG